MAFQKSLAGAWAVLGVGAQLLALSGCSGQAATSDVKSSAPPATAAADSDSGVRQPRRDGPGTTRLPRAFFEKSIVGTLAIGNDLLESAIDWQVEPAHADGSDRQGCAVFERQPELALCFNVLADVSSLGVNGVEVSLRGLCPGGAGRARFVDSTRDESSLSVRFKLDCKGRQTDVRFALRQL